MQSSCEGEGTQGQGWSAEESADRGESERRVHEAGLREKQANQGSAEQDRVIYPGFRFEAATAGNRVFRQSRSRMLVP
jgi:hypothetical protein